MLQCMVVKNWVKWARDFKDAGTDVHGLEYRRMEVRGLRERVPDLSKSMIDKILTEHLHYREVCTSWVLK